MSLATSNRDGGKTSESGHLRAIMKGLKAQVLTGLNVTQRGAGANMSVDVQIGDAVIPRSDGTYGHPAWADAIENKTITTADPSNPRRDIVVMYIDYGQAPSTAVSNNINGVVKIAVVAGTPAGSPTDPSGATIQSAVGSGNPYIKLARVRVGAGVTTISNSVIDDLRLMATGLVQGGWIYDDLYTWVYGGTDNFTINGVDARAQFPAGTRIAINQSGTTKYFIVAYTTYSTNTTIYLDGGATDTLSNVPIDRPAFSYNNNPTNFPSNRLYGLLNIAAAGTSTRTAAGFAAPGSNGMSGTIKVPASGKLKVTIGGLMFASGGTPDDGYASFALSGANTLAASTANAMSVKQLAGITISRTVLLTGLNPGDTTVTMQLASSAATTISLLSGRMFVEAVYD